jgi:uncharacterized protein (TIGR02246 family)
MRRLLAIAVAIVLSVGAMSGIASAQSNEGSIRSDLVNEGTIRTLYEAFTAAWNKHDTTAMAAMWAIDGDHLEPDGRLAKGREAVSKLFAAQHDSVFKKTTLKLTLDDVWFITGDVALIDGNYEVTGAVLPDGTAIPPRKGHLTSVLMKEQDRWWIAASRLMIPTHLPYKK